MSGAAAPFVHPASPGQRRLWYLQRLHPQAPVNNLNVAWVRRGPLDAGALRAAVAALVERHESLRTTLREGPDGPEQVVHPAPGEVPVVETDLAGLPPGERAAELERLQQEDARRPFDLSRWPLLRLRLVHRDDGGQRDDGDQRDDGEHVVVAVLHHAIVDAASIEVLSAELAELLTAAAERRAPRLPPVRVQYVDYTAWQAARLASPEARESLAWWREHLAGVPVLALQPGRPRPRVAGEGDERLERWPPRFVGRVAELGRRHGVTTFTTVLAAWATLLARYGRADDLAVGTPVSDRADRELAGVVGFFVNLVAVRVDLSGDPSFTELLGRVRRSVLGSLSHQGIPFEQVVDAVRPERAPAETPLFQAGLNLVPIRAGAAGGGYWSGGYEFANGTAKYDLFLILTEDEDGGLSVSLDWCRGLLPDAVFAAMAGQLRTLLDAAADEPGTPVSRLPLLDPDGEADAGALLDRPVADGPSADDRVLRPWQAVHAPVGPGERVVLDGRGWSAALVRRWVADGVRVLRSWTPPGLDRPVIGGPWEDAPGAARAPLGRPLPGARVRVVDAAGRPVPLAVPGELHVAVDGGPLRPTGEVVRVLPGGLLEHVARAGARLRVRGHPVDPETVEAALLEEPDVAAAAVVAGSGGLAAHVGLRPGATVTGPQLRAALVSRLAPHQVPDAVAVLADPPLRPDGTLDVERLPATAPPAAEPGTVAPRTDVERRLAAIWADVLGRDEVGVTDNFFALGGDSFSCLRIVTAAAEAGLAVSAVDVFSRQTVAELARVLPDPTAGAADVSTPAVPAGVLRRLGPRPVLVAELDRAPDPAALRGWPVRVDPGAGGTRLVGDGALLDDLSWTLLLGAVAAGGPVPDAPAPLPLPAYPPPGAGPAPLPGDWTAASVEVPLDAAAAGGALGAAPVDLLLAALAGVLPDRCPVVEVADPDRLLGAGDAARPAGRSARDLRVELPGGGSGTAGVEAVRAAKEVLRAAAGADDPARTTGAPHAAGSGDRGPGAAGAGGARSGAADALLTVLPGLPEGVRDVDDGSGPLLAPVEVRARLAAASVRLTLRGLVGTWPPARLRALAGALGEALAAAAASVAALDERVYTPSDFPEAGLDQDQLDRLLGRIGGAR